jgi:hypothetical protein
MPIKENLYKTLGAGNGVFDGLGGKNSAINNIISTAILNLQEHEVIIFKE